MFPNRFRAFLALAALAPIGCAPSPESTCTQSLDEAAATIATAYCEVLDRCGLTATAEGTRGTSLEACSATLTAEFANDHYARIALAVERGTTAYDACSVGACAAAIRAQPCGPSVYVSVAFDACAAMFQGRIPDGAECTFDEECTPTSTCNGAATTCPTGHCMHVGQVGESCGSTPCTRSAFCDGTTCAARRGEGAACDPTRADPGCDRTLVCTAAGTCGAFTLLGTGMPCGPGAGRCAPGLVCDHVGTTYTCRAPRTDGTCREDYYVATADCAGRGACEGGATSDGHCVPYPAAGEACSGPCRAPARCVGGTCVTSSANGASCAADAECWSGACVAGTCEPAPLCGTP